MNLKNYETTFLLSSLLKKEEVEQQVQKVLDLLQKHDATVVYQHPFMLQALAYPLQKKQQAFCQTIEFQASPQLIKTLEIDFKRNENVLRFLTTQLDEYGVAYNEEQRTTDKKKEKEEEIEEKTTTNQQ